jgi:hypothetical protein
LKSVIYVDRMTGRQAMVTECMPVQEILHAKKDRQLFRSPAEAREVAKLFQTTAACAFVLEEGPGNFVMYHVFIPTAPLVVDRVTAQTTKAIVSTYIGSPAVEDLLGKFPRVIHIVCSDRAGANI